ncbi:MAG: TonB-dependent receptor, partial [Prevotellaceae bacterium]|nr:TonB-dependent receptor [Prevotellaceae bacterium]
MRKKWRRRFVFFDDLFRRMDFRGMLIEGIIIVLLICGCCHSAIGQGKVRKAEIKGKVTDGRTGAALAGASIFALDTSVGTISDSGGRFELTLAYGTYMIVVSLPGYRDMEIEIVADALLSGEIFEVTLDPASESDGTPVSVPVRAGDIEDTGSKRVGESDAGRRVGGEPVGRVEVGKMEVKGEIADSRTGRMLSGVSVFALDTPVGTVSDDRGVFVLTLAYGTYMIVVSLQGYRDAEFELAVDASLSGNPLKVTLDPEIGESDAAVVAERAAAGEIKRLPVASASVRGNMPDAGLVPVRAATEQGKVEKTDRKAEKTDRKAERTEIKGTVTDANTGIALAGASILKLGTSEGAVSSNDGHFVLPLARGKHTIVVSFVGYQDAEMEVAAGDSSANAMLEVTLDPAAEELEAVVISAADGAKNVKNVNMGVERLTIKEIQRLPVLMGEVDVLKAIQRLPGVQAAAEGGSGFSVRGGSPDQNLILLDNSTVYNASHLMGFFSVFNNDVVGGLELYKGDLPLKYGGRLSSLLSVHGKTEMPQHGVQGSGGIGIIATRLTLEGALGSRTSWILGGRRSYADVFLPLSKDESLRHSSIYFYDMNAKLTHRFANGDRLELNGYYGGDRFGSDIGKFRYGNFAASIGWRHIFSPSSRSRISLNISDYSYNIASDLESVDATWDAGIRDYTLQADFDHDIGSSTEVNYGITSTFHRFNPGHVTVTGYADYEVQG